MNLFNNIKALCKSRNMTITSLERELGFSVASIVKWQTNRNPSLKSVMKVAQFF